MSAEDWPVAFGFATKDFTSDAASNYTGTSTNTTIYSKDGKFVIVTKGSSMSFDSSQGMKLGNSSNPGALMFYVSTASNITVTVQRTGTNTDVNLDYMGASEPATMTGSNMTTSGTNIDTKSISSNSTDYTLSKNGASAGYYKVYAAKRFSIKSIQVTAYCTSVAAPASLTCSDQTSTSLTFSWTPAENASKYTATLYSDAECTSEVATQSNIATTSVTFSTLSASTTYYCKVQSNGDGETYCEEGNVTDAASGTTGAKTYTVTVNVNDADMGSAVADAGSLDEDETAEITATPNSGYKFDSWAVIGTGAELSSTTDNPTTLTIGSADATVTATFRALYTYTISYAAGTGDGITGSKADETKTEDEAFTLPSTAVFTRSGYVQTGWATSDGGDKAYELGGSYTTNAAQTFYPYWTAANTLTFDANGGAGSMETQQGVGAITLTANAFTKSGYTFIGWATSQANADAGTVAYADGASYTLSANAILYAVWAENYFEFTPATSGDELAVGDVISGTGFGGFIKVAGLRYYQDASKGTSIAYNASGLALTGGGADSLRVELNDYMQPGTIIVVKMTMGGTTAPRGLYINTTTAAHSRVELLGFQSEGFENGQVGVFTYTVKADDGLAGRKSFGLQRQNSVYVKSITIVNCQPGATTTSTGWCTYSSHKALDLSTLTDGFTAYVAKEVNGDKNVIMSSTNAIVPANTGLMIKGTASTKFTIDATSEEATFSGTNLLVALPEGGTVTAANNTSEWNYVFGYEDAESYGFYKINGEAATLGLGKAYLHTTTALATAGSARLGIIFDDETTGITSTAMQPSTEQYFNLAGQRVAQPTKGLYIVNGKKIVIR